ncbi:MAG: hypothetical protein WC254_01200 [Candidatus Woesearchaeota archaeon]|jgi:hypothetical protein
MDLKTRIGLSIAGALVGFTALSAGSRFYDGTNENSIKIHHSTQSIPDKKSKEREVYAVLVNGLINDDSPNKQVAGYQGILNAYNAITSTNTPSDHIYVLDNPQRENSPFNGVHIFDPTKKNLEQVLDTVAPQITENDLFILYIASHGSLPGPYPIGEAYFKLSDAGQYQVTYEQELEDHLTNISSDAVQIHVYDFCLGGNFSERLGHGNTIALSPAKKNKVSTTGDETVGENMRLGAGFSSYFFEEFASGNNVNASFDYAVDKTKPHEHPYLDLDTPLSVFGFQISTNFTDFFRRTPILNKVLNMTPTMSVGNIDPQSVYLRN